MRAHLLRASVLLLSLSASAWPADAPAGGYVFELDGKPFTPGVLSLEGTPDEPRPGDAIHVAGHWITLGTERELRFQTPALEEGRLLLADKEGKTRTVAVSVRTRSRDDKNVLVNPLASMAADEVRGLWGVGLDASEIPEHLATVFDRLRNADPERLCLSIEFSGNVTLPGFPQGLRSLIVEQRGSPATLVWGAPTFPASLRLLQWDGMGDFDVSRLGACRALRYLEVSGDFADGSALQDMPELRHLDVNWNNKLESCGFARNMPNLRQFLASRTALNDLSPLDGHRTLAVLWVDQTPVRKLPAGALPALRELRIMSTPVATDAVAAFEKDHPACTVWHRWETALRRQTEGATRLRLRTGGTCHRNPADEKTLAEIRDAEKIRQILCNIKINEEESGGHCMCCGEPTLEFYRGDTILSSLTLHHGRSLRWSGGWPGDGVLEAGSSEFLCRWLAQQGVPGPLADIEAARKGRETFIRRWNRYRQILPPSVVTAFQNGVTAEQANAIVLREVPGGPQRAALAFRLYGCDNGSWNHAYGLDELVRDWLDGIGKEDVAGAAGRVVADEDGARGLARWLYDDEKWESMDAKDLAKVLPASAREGLSHPRPLSRSRTLLALEKIRTDESTAALRAVLSGGLKPRPLPEADEHEPGGQVVIKPGDPEVADGCSDAAHAALALARRGDKESLPAIKALAEKAADENDKKVLEKAVGLLTGK